MLDVARLTRLGFRALNGVVRPLVERGVGNPPVLGIGPVVVQTTGRRSGLARRVPLLAARVGDTVYVSTVRPDSQWLANLQADSGAVVRLFGRDMQATAELSTAGPLHTAALHMQPV